MIIKFLHRFLEPRHYWRQVGFDELSELYTSQLLRSLAISLIGLFTPVYLYKLGYSLSDIAFFHVGWFLFRPLFDVICAYIIARIGPKHTMLISLLIHVIYLSLLLTISDFRWPLMVVAAVGSSAYSLHLLAVQVNFSKIKHSEHGGKELGYMVAVERIGGVFGPLIGGLLANYYDPRYTIGLAMVALLASAIPLFFTEEAVHTKQKITFRGLPFRSRKYDFISTIPATLENVVSIIVWPLFIAVFVLGDNTFAKLGAIAALSTLSSIVLSRAIGGVIDNRKGRELLKIGVIINALLHFARPFTGSLAMAATVNVANEPITASYRMPLIKGLFDAADSLPGYRIAYLSAISVVDSASRLVFWIVVWLAMNVYTDKSVLMATFVFAGICSIGILSERYEALRPKKFTF